MIISLKDAFKLFGIAIVCCCAVFVCTFMLNFYMDVLPLKGTLTEGNEILFEAQLATAQFTSIISGGVLGLISVIMLVFYIKLYIDGHSAQIGILKAMGYPDGKLALRFGVFGLSVLVGCSVGFGAGYAFMPYVYKSLLIDGLPQAAINFHVGLLFGLVVAPTAVYTVLSCFYAYFALRRPVMEMIKGKSVKYIDKNKNEKVRPFLADMCVKTLNSKKSLAFFVAFACFCFSAMVQMGLSMEKLTSSAMGTVILLIGVVLAVTSLIMAATSLINGNMKNISIMKAFGYSMRECAVAVLAGYVPVALAGFALGTVYQYGLLQLMVNIVFEKVGEVPEYNFNVPVFFITLAIFIVAYAALNVFYVRRLNKISVKEVMLEG